MAWDPSAHGWAGLGPALALLDGRPGDAAAMLWAQEAWPPLFGLLCMPSFFVLGPSALGPLVVVAACWCLAMFGVWHLAGSLAREPAAPWVAAALALWSPTWLGYAGRCMTETAGAACTALALWALVRRRPWAAALASTAAFFVKFNVGIPLLATLTAVVAVHLGRRRRARSWLVAWMAGAVAPLAVWFASPGKLGTFMTYARDAAHFDAGLSTPASAAAYLARAPAAWAPHWTVGALVVAAAAAGAWRARRTGWPVALSILVTAAMLAVHPTDDARHLLVLSPAIFALAGAGLADGWRWPVVPWMPALAVLAAAVGLLHPVARALPRSDLLGPDERRLLEAVVEEVRAPWTVVYGAQAAAPPEAVKWQVVLHGPVPQPYVLVDPPPDVAPGEAAVVLGMAIDPQGPSAGELASATVAWRQRIVRGLERDPALDLVRRRAVPGLGVDLLVFRPRAAAAETPRLGRADAVSSPPVGGGGE